MTILKSINEGENLSRLYAWPAAKIGQAFLANYVANLMIARVGDVASLSFINAQHSTHKHFSTAMSPVDFWAYVIFVAPDKMLAKYLQPTAIAKIKEDGGRILSARVDKITKSCKVASDVINWQEAIYSILLLAVRFEINFPALQGIVRALYNWDKIGAAARASAIAQTSRFLRMADADSALLPPITKMTMTGFMQNIINPIDTISNKIKGFFRVAEEDGGVVPGSDATLADAISPLPRMIFKDGQIIKRKKRNFKILKWKDPSSGSKDYSNVKIA